MNTKRKRGQPTKYCQETVEKILFYKRLGSSDRYAALSSGIHPATLIEWKTVHPEFEQLLQQAKADGVNVNLLRMNETAAKGNVNSIRYLLNRFDPEEFPKDEYNLNINIRVEDLSDEELQNLAAGIPTTAISSPSRTGTEEESQDTTYTVLD